MRDLICEIITYWHFKLCYWKK